MKQTIAVDIDDVLFPNSFRLVQTYNRKHGTNIEQPAMLLNGVLKGTLENLEEHTGLQRELIIEQVEQLLSEPEFHDILPLEASQSVLSELATKFELIAVSSRPKVMLEQTHLWIAHHYESVFSNIHILGGKWGHGIFVDKTKLLKEQDVSYLIDDLLKNAQEAATAGIQAVLFGEYPWNETDALPDAVTRCRDWQAVLEYFDGKC